MGNPYEDLTDPARVNLENRGGRSTNEMEEPVSELIPEWNDIPEDDNAEPEDADTDHKGIPAEEEVG